MTEKVETNELKGILENIVHNFEEHYGSIHEIEKPPTFIWSYPDNPFIEYILSIVPKKQEELDLHILLTGDESVH